MEDNKIIAYIENKLSREEREIVRQQIESDDATRINYQSYLLLYEAMNLASDEDLRQKLISESVSRNTSKKVISLRQFYLVAAASILILCIAFFILRPSTGEKLFAEFYTPPALDVYREGSSDLSQPIFTEFNEAYAFKEYSTIIKLYTESGENVNLSFEAFLIYLDALISSKNEKQVLSEIEAYIQQNELTEVEKQRLDWTKALILLKTNDYDNLKNSLEAIVNDSTHIYVIKSKELNSRLE